MQYRVIISLIDGLQFRPSTNLFKQNWQGTYIRENWEELTTDCTDFRLTWVVFPVSDPR